MKQIILFFILISTSIFYAQEKQVLISGYIRYNDLSINDVHVVNTKTNKGTISNNYGRYEINVTALDVLKFTHINFEAVEIIITKELLDEGKIDINLTAKTHNLDEIIIEKPKSIFHVEKDILPPPIVNAETLNLPYANTKPKKDNQIIKLQSGGIVNLTSLINSLNGNAKKERELKKITYEDKVLKKIRTHFTDDFFITDLNIKKEHINLFLNYCFKKGVIDLYNSNQKIKLLSVLMKESRTFPQKTRTELTLINKN